MITWQALLISVTKSLLFTLLAEVCAAYIAGCRKKLLVLCIAVNILTNPLAGLSLDWIYIITGSMPQWYWILVTEAAVVFAEGYIYSRSRLKTPVNPYILSLLLNSISFFGGKFL